MTTTPTALTATGPIAAVVRKDSLEMASSVKVCPLSFGIKNGDFFVKGNKAVKGSFCLLYFDLRYR